MAAAEEKLLATDGLKKFCNSLKTPKEKDDFRAHLRRYMSIYLSDCPFEVNATNRYTIVTHEASVTARRYIKPNETIKYLSGIQVVITPEEEAEMALRKKDFSIVVSSRNKCTSLFMGPARFANHDCGANARLVTSGQAGIEIIACKPIDVGDEITVTYGENYFGEDNCECLCRTCEENLVNGWKNEDGGVAVTKSIEDDLVGATQGYSLRRRRRDESACGASSRTPSVTPDIRPRVLKRSKSQRMLGGRASTVGSAAPEPSGIRNSALKRKRDTLATPPVTPAKKQKTTHYELTPVMPGSPSSRGSSNAGFGPSPVPSEAGQGDAMLTDVTTPAEDSPEPIIHSPELTPIQRSIQVIKQEDAADEITVQTVPDAMPPFGISRLMLPSANLPATSPSASDEGARDPSGNNPQLIVLPAMESLGTESALESATHHQRPTSPNERPLAPNDPLLTPSKAPQSAATPTATDAPIPVKRGRGRPRKSEPPAKPKQPAVANRKRKAVSRTPAASPAPSAAAEEEEEQPQQRRRLPGDYTLTPLLLSEPETAWIHCTNCNSAFVQRDAYYTRSSCPRCERHSKLYGYVWPKTERGGRGDGEERVLDHRMVHRFLAADEEAKVRGRAHCRDRLLAQEDAAGLGQKRGRGRAVAKEEEQEEVQVEIQVGLDDAENGLRRSGRIRKVSVRASMG